MQRRDGIAGHRHSGSWARWLARLSRTEATVKTRLLNIYARPGVSDRAAAVAEAFNRGLLTRRS